MKKVVVCIPTIARPYKACLDSLEASVPHMHDAGWDHYMVNEVGCPYISVARAKMLRKAQAVAADAIVFIDHDVSWKPENLVKLLQTEGDVVSGTYRFKRDKEEYMGALQPDINQRPQVREDGCVLAHCIPAGFMKITREGLAKFMYHFPELQYVEEGTLTVDLFNHGVHKGVWYGEDYAFSRNWNERCGKIWIIPDMDIDHHSTDAVYKGNFHKFLLRQEGGSDA